MHGYLVLFSSGRGLCPLLRPPSPRPHPYKVTATTSSLNHESRFMVMGEIKESNCYSTPDGLPHTSHGLRHSTYHASLAEDSGACNPNSFHWGGNPPKLPLTMGRSGPPSNTRMYLPYSGCTVKLQIEAGSRLQAGSRIEAGGKSHLY